MYRLASNAFWTSFAKTQIFEIRKIKVFKFENNLFHMKLRKKKKKREERDREREREREREKKESAS